MIGLIYSSSDFHTPTNCRAASLENFYSRDIVQQLDGLVATDAREAQGDTTGNEGAQISEEKSLSLEGLQGKCTFSYLNGCIS